MELRSAIEEVERMLMTVQGGAFVSGGTRVGISIDALKALLVAAKPTPTARDEQVARASAWLTCKCGKRMIGCVERRPLTDPAFPRETFAEYEMLSCACGERKERRLTVGH
jgi:hypothetical protein